MNYSNLYYTLVKIKKRERETIKMYDNLKKIAFSIVDLARQRKIKKITPEWVINNFENINTTSKAVAILNIAVDLNLLTKKISHGKFYNINIIEYYKVI